MTLHLYNLFWIFIGQLVWIFTYSLCSIAKQSDERGENNVHLNKF